MKRTELTNKQYKALLQRMPELMESISGVKHNKYTVCSEGEETIVTVLGLTNSFGEPQSYTTKAYVKNKFSVITTEDVMKKLINEYEPFLPPTLQMLEYLTENGATIFDEYKKTVTHGNSTFHNMRVHMANGKSRKRKK